MRDRPLTVEELYACLKILELSEDILKFPVGGWVEAAKRLDEFQQRVKMQRRKLAKKYHPDKVAHLGADHVREANNRLGTINDAADKLTAIQMKPPPQPSTPAPRAHFYTTTGTSGTAGFGMDYSFIFVMGN